MRAAWASRLGNRLRRLRRWLGDAGVAALLLVSAALLTIAAVTWPTQLRPAVVLSLPVLAAGLLLGRREVRIVLAASVLLLAAATAVVGGSSLQIGGGTLFAVIAVVSYEQSRRWEETGLRTGRPDVVLRELRDRLRVQGELPPLPAGWGVDVELRPARGSGLAGDFVVSRLDLGDGRQSATLDVALVDVSGKGVDAGTRALLLSGALGGLLGSVPPPRFLAEANRYLRRQRWTEGFATAVYLRLELDSGAYRVVSAGHPPAVHFDSGSGRWRLAATRGPLLGVFAEVRHEPDTGRLRPGDALLLYTDGLVEDRRHDLEVGLDRLLGAAERLVPRGDFRGGAAELVDRVAARTDDDRAVVLLWRR